MIEVDGLTFRYGDSQAGISDVSFSVGAGEIAGFLGPSGAGKSTTQKVLIGLLRPFAGEVRILGKDLRSYGPEYYERIGVGFELPNHYMKLTALENLRFFAAFYRATRDPRELLQLVGLGDAADQRAEELSKGMKMRLNFARALLHDPDVLFLDEPTNGLDPANARLLKDIVREERDRGRCIFLTTHNMHEADELCDTVAFIVDGRIARVGTPRELRASDKPRTVVVEVAAEPAPGTELLEFGLDGLGANPEFLDVLRTREIVSLQTPERTLEDVFMEVTGRRLS